MKILIEVKVISRMYKKERIELKKKKTEKMGFKWRTKDYVGQKLLFSLKPFMKPLSLLLPFIIIVIFFSVCTPWFQNLPPLFKLSPPLPALPHATMDGGEWSRCGSFHLLLCIFLSSSLVCAMKERRAQVFRRFGDSPANLRHHIECVCSSKFFLYLIIDS